MMEIILLEKVRNLGNVGDKVSVKPGFGRNFLIPQGMAVPANDKNLAEFEAKRAEFEKHAAEQLVEAQQRAEKLKDLVLTVAANVTEDGDKLFGSVGAQEISDAFEAAGVSVEKKEIDLPEGPIRTIGEHTVHIQFHSDVEVMVTVNVVAAV